MALIARDKGGGDFEPVNEGTHPAICIGVFDIGTHYDETYGKEKHECIFMWELPLERIEIEKDGVMKNLPRAISRQFTVSLHKKAQLRPFLESWRGRTFTEEELKGFDITKVLGARCMLQVLHTKKGDKTYANVVSIIPLMQGMEKTDPENPLRKFSFEEDIMPPDGTPAWIKKRIESSEEWVFKHGETGEISENNSIPDDAFPF